MRKGNLADSNLWKTAGAVFLTFLVSACVSQMDTIQSKFVTPQELNSNPAQYEGQSVVVRGFVVLGTNARYLYQSEERLLQLYRDFEEDRPEFYLPERDKDCLTLLNADEFWENRSILDGQTISIQGIFVKNYMDGTVVDIQACSGPTAFVVDGEYLLKTIVKLKGKNSDDNVPE